MTNENKDSQIIFFLNHLKFLEPVQVHLTSTSPPKSSIFSKISYFLTEDTLAVMTSRLFKIFLLLIK